MNDFRGLERRVAALLACKAMSVEQLRTLVERLAMAVDNETAAPILAEVAGVVSAAELRRAQHLAAFVRAATAAAEGDPEAVLGHADEGL